MSNAHAPCTRIEVRKSIVERLNYPAKLDSPSVDEELGFNAGSRVDGSPTVVDGTVYVGSRGHSLYVLDGCVERINCVWVGHQIKGVEAERFGYL